MKIKNENLPAYPCPNIDYWATGLTKREYIATQLLIQQDEGVSIEQQAYYALRRAEALLKALEEKR